MDHQENFDLLTSVVQLLIEQGSNGCAEGIRLLVNEAMVRERAGALRTTNPLERINQELKRRTRGARVPLKEVYLLCLIPALLNEIYLDWETRKIYLNLPSFIPPTT